MFKLLDRQKTMIHMWKLVSWLTSSDLIINPYVFKLEAFLCLETTDSWGRISPYPLQRLNTVRQTARDFKFYIQ